MKILGRNARHLSFIRNVYPGSVARPLKAGTLDYPPETRTAGDTTTLDGRV